MLERCRDGFYAKYIDHVEKHLSSKKSCFIDLGCGNGNVLKLMKKKGYSGLSGYEVSNLFVKAARKRGLKNVFLYNGDIVPVDDNVAEVAGSFGVLEHVGDPTTFLKEHIRIVKPGGYIVVTCPNFLTVLFKLEHPSVNTLYKRLFNIPKIIGKIFSGKVSFEKVAPIIREEFHGDDDMVTVANLIDLERFFKTNDCEIVYANGFMINDSLLFRFFGSIPIFRYFLPSCFLVARKGYNKT